MLMAAVARPSDVPQRTHEEVPGMFSNWQLKHCI